MGGGGGGGGGGMKGTVFWQYPLMEEIRLLKLWKCSIGLRAYAITELISSQGFFEIHAIFHNNRYLANRNIWVFLKNRSTQNISKTLKSRVVIDILSPEGSLRKENLYGGKIQNGYLSFEDNFPFCPQPILCTFCPPPYRQLGPSALVGLGLSLDPEGRNMETNASYVEKTL